MTFKFNLTLQNQLLMLDFHSLYYKIDLSFVHVKLPTLSSLDIYTSRV